MRRALVTGCTVAVTHTAERLDAHVVLDGDVALNPGDQVQVHGAPIRLAFGQTLVERRTATVRRAGPLARAWTRLTARLELAELYDLSFSSGKVP
ncbi:hypothetical protein [Zavarzinia sp. CC-PAN008]|uniref:hypothetical protein n=1 Tax=Zavarzinia sp. CC-PAN008 TaxID=3243332 RepID=UPI003F746529